jgi:hypothetical protein
MRVLLPLLLLLLLLPLLLLLLLLLWVGLAEIPSIALQLSRPFALNESY